MSLVLFLFPSFLHPFLLKTSQTSMVHREVDYATRNKWTSELFDLDSDPEFLDLIYNWEFLVVLYTKKTNLLNG